MKRFILIAAVATIISAHSANAAELVVKNNSGKKQIISFAISLHVRDVSGPFNGESTINQVWGFFTINPGQSRTINLPRGYVNEIWMHSPSMQSQRPRITLGNNLGEKYGKPTVKIPKAEGLPHGHHQSLKYEAMTNRYIANALRRGNRLTFYKTNLKGTGTLRFTLR